MAKISNNQNILDLVIQETGSVFSVMEILKANDLGITDVLSVGTEVEIPEVKNEKIYNYYKKNDIRPATLKAPFEEEEVLPGIGEMQVGTTFIIS